MKPIRRRNADKQQVSRMTYVLTAGNAVFGGLTGVGIPVALNEFGLSKLDIAMFFVVNAGIAILYNCVLMPRVQRRGYPWWILTATAAAVPLGLGTIALGRGFLPLLYGGGALMMFVATLVPQVLGRIARQSGSASPETIVSRLRQVLVAGYIIGLALYALLSAAGVSPLLVALGVGVCTAAATLAPAFRVRLAPLIAGGSRRAGNSSIRMRLVLLAIALVAFMKCVDALRMIYLPLFSADHGLPASSISMLFLVSSVCELVSIPFLARISSQWGPARTLALISAVGAVSFLAPLLTTNFGALALSQVLYAVFGAGFQSIGLVLLARVLGGDVGLGASTYMAVVQVGMMLGAVLPLLVPGYDSSLFLIAIVACLLCACLSLVLSRAQSATGSGAQKAG